MIRPPRSRTGEEMKYFQGFDLNRAFYWIDPGQLLGPSIIGMILYVIVTASQSETGRFYLSVFGLYCISLFALQGGVDGIYSKTNDAGASITAALFTFAIFVATLLPAVAVAALTSFIAPRTFFVAILVYGVLYSAYLGKRAGTELFDRKLLAAFLYGLPAFAIAGAVASMILP